MKKRENYTNTIQKLSDNIAALQKFNTVYLNKINDLNFRYLRKQQKMYEELSIIDPFYIQNDLNNKTNDISYEIEKNKLLDLFFRQIIVFRIDILADKNLLSIIRKEYKIANILLYRVFTFESQFKKYHIDLLTKILQPEIRNVKAYKTILFSKLLHGYLKYNPNVFIGIIMLLEKFNSTMTNLDSDKQLLLNFINSLLDNCYMYYLKYFVKIAINLTYQEDEAAMVILYLIDLICSHIIENFDTSIIYVKNYYNSFNNNNCVKNLILRLRNFIKNFDVIDHDIVAHFERKISININVKEPVNLTNHYISINVSDCKDLIKFMAKNVHDFNKYHSNSIQKSLKNLIIQIKLDQIKLKNEYQINLLNVIERIKARILNEHKHLYYFNMIANAEEYMNDVIVQRFCNNISEFENNNEYKLKQIELEIDSAMKNKVIKKNEIFIITSSIMQSQLSIPDEKLTFETLNVSHLYHILDKNRLEIVLIELARVVSRLEEERDWLINTLKNDDIKFNQMKSMFKHIRKLVHSNRINYHISKIIEQRKFNFVVKLEFNEKNNKKHLAAIRLATERLEFKNRLLLNSKLFDSHIEHAIEVVDSNKHKKIELHNIKQVFSLIKKYHLFLLALKRDDVNDFLTILVTQICEEIYEVIVLLIDKNVQTDFIKKNIREYVFNEFNYMAFESLKAEELGFTLPTNKEIEKLFSGWSFNTIYEYIKEFNFLDSNNEKFKDLAQIKLIFLRINKLLAQIPYKTTEKGIQLLPKVI